MTRRLITLLERLGIAVLKLRAGLPLRDIRGGRGSQILGRGRR